jgi:hypothetical protein
MRPGRPLLRYFTESELSPPDKLRDQPNEPPALLRDEELKDLKEFASEFSRSGEATALEADLSHQRHLAAFISLCVLLGAVSVRRSAGRMSLRSTGKLARHVPEILCVYFERSYTLFEDWNRLHLIPEGQVSALEFLHQMELRRISQEKQNGRTARHLEERPVAFAVFHARNDRGEGCYLFEVNKDWRRLNLIGGKQESVDGGDFTRTVEREISEELGINPHHLRMTRLNDAPLVGYSLSGNAGSLARYPCVLYAVRVDGSIPSRLQDRWLTEATIRDAAKRPDCPIMVNPAYLAFLLEGSPSRLSTLPLSTDTIVSATDVNDLLQHAETTPGRWRRVVRENKDLAAAVLTLVAAVITLALAL